MIFTGFRSPKFLGKTNLAASLGHHTPVCSGPANRHQRRACAAEATGHGHTAANDAIDCMDACHQRPVDDRTDPAVSKSRTFVLRTRRGDSFFRGFRKQRKDLEFPLTCDMASYLLENKFSAFRRYALAKVARISAFIDETLVP